MKELNYQEITTVCGGSELSDLLCYLTDDSGIYPQYPDYALILPLTAGRCSLQ